MKGKDKKEFENHPYEAESIYQNNINIQKANERKQMIKQVLDTLWNGPHKVNNKLDGYWYVRLSEVSKALEEYEK